MKTHKGPCRQPRGNFKRFSKVSPKVGFFYALQEIANSTSDAVDTVVHTLRPIIGVRTHEAWSKNQGRVPSVIHPIDPPLLQEEVGPLRNMVIDCLTSISHGERNPHDLRRLFETRFNHSKRAQATALTFMHPGNGRPTAIFTGALSEIVFQEIISLAASGVLVARCALHTYPGECRHFFFPDNEKVACCSDACADRRSYLKWPPIPTTPKKRRQKHA